jgi:hypothetical protein
MIIEFTPEEVEWIVDMGIQRNKEKRNQTISRGLPPRVKHIMGVFAEKACEKYLLATMDWKIYKGRGDNGRPDGTLPDGRGCVVKAVGKEDMDVWVPLECLEKASDRDLVIAVQVIPKEEAFLTYSYGVGRAPEDGGIGFLGYLPVKEFLTYGRRNWKHYYSKDAWTGKTLSRDVCIVLPRQYLRPILELCSRF